MVVLDSVSGLLHAGESAQVMMAVLRQVAMLKARGITAVLTTLTGAVGGDAAGPVVSSLVDTWLLLRNVETNGEHNRLLFVRKSRGSAHSNQVREFVLTDHGVELLDVYVGPGGLLTGKARLAQEAADRVAASRPRQKLERVADGSCGRMRRRSRRTSPVRTRRWPTIAPRWHSTAGLTRRLPPSGREARDDCAAAGSAAPRPGGPGRQPGGAARHPGRGTF